MGPSMKSLRKLIACDIAFTALSAFWVNAAVNIYVSPAGNDSNPGSSDKPVATLAAAQKLARSSAGHQRRRPARPFGLAALHEWNFPDERPGGFADRGNFRQRRAADSGTLPGL